MTDPRPWSSQWLYPRPRRSRATALRFPRGRRGCGYRGYLLENDVVVVALELLRHGHVNLALVFRHQLQPAGVAGIGAGGLVVDLEVGFFLDQLGVDGEVGADEEPVLG